MPLTKVSSGVIAANAVVDSFGTQSITGDKIGLGAITGNTLASNIINANNIVNASITGAKIALGTITGDDIATGQITGNLLTANCVSGNNIVASVTLTTPVLGTPTSGTLTNCTGLPTGGIAAVAWTSYTPIITAQTGTFETVSASGAYQTIGKTCIVSVTINITTVGTASGFIAATLPFTSAARIQIGGYGMEVNSTGNMLKGYIPSSSTQLQVKTYSNGETIGAGYSNILTVVYETA